MTKAHPEPLSHLNTKIPTSLKLRINAIAIQRSTGEVIVSPSVITREALEIGVTLLENQQTTTADPGDT